MLRTLNDTSHQLGLPLPSGRVSSFADDDGAPLLLGQSSLRDLAVGEKVEIALAYSAEVRIDAVHDGPRRTKARAWTLGTDLRWCPVCRVLVPARCWASIGSRFTMRWLSPS